MSAVQDKWFQSRARLKQLEDVAGVAEKLGQTLSDHDYSSAKRAIVFSLPDFEKRKQLIRANRVCYADFVAVERERLREIQANIANNGESERRRAVFWSVVCGVVLVVIGNYFWQVPSAIAATIPAFLWGYDNLKSAERKAKRELETFKQELDEQEEFMKELGDGFYSSSEELSGIPDA